MSSGLRDSAARPEKRVEQWMGVLLRAGVLVAALLVLIGGVLYLAALITAARTLGSHDER